MNDLEKRFDTRMRLIFDECAAFGYRPTYFLKMVHKRGGVEAAHELLDSPDGHSGFTRLFEESRLDLSVEALVLEAEFAPLFSDIQKTKARKRLAEYGFTPEGNQ